MKTVSAAIFSFVMCLTAIHVAAATEDACPRTIAEDPLFGAAFPGWYGSEALAVALTRDGRWLTTKPGARVSGGLVWRSSGFRPGPGLDLKLDVKNLNGGPVTARVFEPKNVWIPLEQQSKPPFSELEPTVLGARMMGTEIHRWRMSTGVDFPEPGCWQITAEYLGQTLTFVVESVPRDGEVENPDATVGAPLDELKGR